MKLTTTTQVSVDGVMQGPGGPDEDRSGGFERGGWARPPKLLFGNEAMTFVYEVYQRADAFLFGRRLSCYPPTSSARRKAGGRWMVVVKLLELHAAGAASRSRRSG